MKHSLFPDGAVWAAARLSDRFGVPRYGRESLREQGIALPDGLVSAAPKRISEFAASRLAIRALCARLKTNEPDYGIPATWPPGIAGSLTHTPRIALAVAAREESFRSIGIDAEEILTLESARRIARKALLPEEWELYRASLADLMPEELWVTLVFSAKEAIFKCLHPLCQKMFWFQQARIESADPESGRLRFKLLTELGPGLPEGMEGQVHTRRGKQRVVSLAFMLQHRR